MNPLTALIAQLPSSPPPPPSTNTNKKRQGRPSKSTGKDTEDWSDEEVSKLIEICSTKAIIYNVKHAKYFDKQYHTATLEDIRVALVDDDIIATVKQINDKIHNLKNILW